MLTKIKKMIETFCNDVEKTVYFLGGGDWGKGEMLVLSLFALKVAIDIEYNGGVNAGLWVYAVNWVVAAAAFIAFFGKYPKKQH